MANFYGHIRNIWDAVSMIQNQLPSEDWHITGCPAYHEKYNNCPERLRIFSHCKDCIVKVQPGLPKIESFPKECHRIHLINNGEQQQLQLIDMTVDCGNCQSKGQKKKSCRLLTKRTFKQRKTKIKVKRKGTIAQQKSDQNWLEGKNPELFDKMYDKKEGDVVDR